MCFCSPFHVEILSVGRASAGDVHQASAGPCPRDADRRFTVQEGGVEERHLHTWHYRCLRGQINRCANVCQEQPGETGGA